MRCNEDLKKANQPYPRTCETCGFSRVCEKYSSGISSSLVVGEPDAAEVAQEQQVNQSLGGFSAKSFEPTVVLQTDTDKEKRERLALLEQLRRDLPEAMERAKLVAQHRFIYFTAHVEVGFTPQQALELCKG